MDQTKTTILNIKGFDQDYKFLHQVSYHQNMTLAIAHKKPQQLCWDITLQLTHKADTEM